MWGLEVAVGILGPARHRDDHATESRRLDKLIYQHALLSPCLSLALEVAVSVLSPARHRDDHVTESRRLDKPIYQHALAASLRDVEHKDRDDVAGAGVTPACTVAATCKVWTGGKSVEVKERLDQAHQEECKSLA